MRRFLSTVLATGLLLSTAATGSAAEAPITVIVDGAPLDPLRLMLQGPMRFASEALSGEIRWDEKTRTVDVTTHVGGTITIAVPFEPQMPYPVWETHVLHTLMFDPLMQFDETLTPRPALATGYTVEDGKVITFALRDGVTWHDGTPFTAKDVVYTLELMLDPNHAGLRRFGKIKGAEELRNAYEKVMHQGASTYEEAEAARLALWEQWKQTDAVQMIDDLHVRIELEEPDAPTLTEMATTLILPAHQLEAMGELGRVRSEEMGAPVGTGRYRFIEWAEGNQITLERNPDWHWGPDNRRTRIQRVLLRFIYDPSERLAALQSGAVDVVTGLGIPDTAAGIGNSHVVEHPALTYTFLGYNLKDPILSDVRVRQAITHSVQRERIVKDAVAGHGQVLNSHGLPARWDFNADAPTFDFDPARAAALLDEAGWVMGPDGIRVRDGVPLSIEITTNRGNPTREMIARAIQQSLRQVGIEVKINLLEWNVLLEYLFSGKQQAFILGWGLGYDPDSSHIFHSSGGTNLMGYSNPQVDKLLEAGRRTLDQVKRARIYGEIQKVLAEEQVLTWLFAPNTIDAVSRRVHGLEGAQLGGDALIWQIERWYVTDSEQ